MNERIKELAKGCYVRSSGIEFSNFDYEKFAELIVKECGEISRHHALSRSGHKGKEQEFTGTVDLQEEILKHFGVKE